MFNLNIISGWNFLKIFNHSQSKKHISQVSDKITPVLSLTNQI